jgi:3-oxoacyl-(acyl-carrier-protein) synthase
MNKRRIVVTGMGVISPIGTGIPAFADALHNGKSGIRFSPELQQHQFGCQIAGIPEIDQSKYIPQLDKYGLLPASAMLKYGIVAGLEAWEDAGLSIPEYQEGETDYDTGIILGSGIGSADIFGERIVPLTNEGNLKKLRSTIVEHSMLSGPGATLGGILGLGNKISFNSSACSTGTEAIIEGAERIRRGNAKRMIVGGTDAPSIYGWSGFDAMRVLTRQHNHDPERGSRPMSASAGGFVPAAGAGVLVIEDYEMALSRNAKIYGEICGVHVNAGGQRHGGTMTAPSHAGVVRCIRAAIQDAGIEASQIEYISGHLSSTMADPIEISNWCDALQRKGKDFPFINALKSLTGHCIGAAGAIETIAGLIQMDQHFLHPSLNCEDLHPDIEDLLCPSKITRLGVPQISINTLIKASFGFGDVNACLIIKRIKQ